MKLSEDVHLLRAAFLSHKSYFGMFDVSITLLLLLQNLIDGAQQ